MKIEVFFLKKLFSGFLIPENSKYEVKHKCFVFAEGHLLGGLFQMRVLRETTLEYLFKTNSESLMHLFK